MRPALLSLIAFGLSAASQVVTFDQATIGKLPTGWTANSEWKVVRDQTAHTQPYVLAQTSATARQPLAVLDRIWLRDADISVRLKPISGREDQSGGIVFRYRDPNNYYVARADALAQNVAVYKVAGGQLIPLARAIHHPIAAQNWCILKVAARGPRIAIYVNHRRLLELTDTTFPGPGKIGLWTRADSITYFDDLRITPR